MNSFAKSASKGMRALRTVEAIHEIAPDWRELFLRCRATPFQSPDWLLAWVDAFSPERMICCELRSDGRLVGLAPLLIYRRGSERVLAFMGGGVSDYLDMLVEPGYEAEAVAEMLRFALHLQDEWTILDLTDLGANSALLKVPGLGPHATEHDFCSVVSLPNTEDELLHMFSKRQRANLRNASSRLARAGGGQVEIAAPENFSEFLNDLFALHTSRWAGRGESGVLSDMRIREFHVAVGPALLKSGILHLSRLRLNERTLAVVYSLLGHQTCFCYLQGFDPEFAWFSPGTQLMFSAMKDAVARRLQEFDLLRGLEEYKQHWRAGRRLTYRLQFTRADLEAVLNRDIARASLSAKICVFLQ